MADTELRRRLITGVCIGAVIIGATLSGIIGSYILVLVIIVMSSIEFFRMQAQEHQLGMWPAILSITPALSVSLELINAEHLPVTLWREMIIAIIGAFGLYVILLLISGKKFNVKSFGRLCLALLLITLPGMFAICIGLISPRLLLGMFILLWSSDVFAYFGGKAFGRHKLMPSVSPKKTWEGVFSGLIMVSVAAWGMSYLFPEIALRHWIAIGMLVVVFGTIGDLMQSAVKRAAGVKDSGNILPGHGGFWDRFDSFLGSAPWVGAYLILFYEQT